MERTVVALYRGSSLTDLRLLACSADPDLAADIAERFLAIEAASDTDDFTVVRRTLPVEASPVEEPAVA